MLSSKPITACILHNVYGKICHKKEGYGNILEGWIPFLLDIQAKSWMVGRCDLDVEHLFWEGENIQSEHVLISRKGSTAGTSSSLLNKTAIAYAVHLFSPVTGIILPDMCTVLRSYGVFPVLLLEDLTHWHAQCHIVVALHH